MSADYHPDVTGAEVYAEAAPNRLGSIRGTWYVLPHGEVVYQQPDGRFQPATISAETLRTDPYWTRTA